MKGKMVIISAIMGLWYPYHARGYFFVKSANDAVMMRQSKFSEDEIFRVVGQCAGNEFIGLDEDERARFMAAIKKVQNEIGSVSKSRTLPRQCFAYSGSFEIDGHRIDASSVTNKIRAMDLEWIESERAKGRNYRVAGVMETRVRVALVGGETWRACLSVESCSDDAIEIAIARVLYRSSMTLDMNAESIVFNDDDVGDFYLSRKSDDENLRNSFLTFVRGGCAVVVWGGDALRIAKLIDRILCECGRAYEKGEIITIATAAERLLKKHNSEGVRSAASERSTEGTIR